MLAGGCVPLEDDGIKSNEQSAHGLIADERIALHLAIALPLHWDAVTMRTSCN